MPRVITSRIGGFALALIFLAYPLAVYFLMDTFGPVALALLLLILLVPRLVLLLRKAVPAAFIVIGIAICYFTLLNLADSVFVLKLYPMFFSLALLGLFGFTLIRPPSMIERLARGLGMSVSERGIGYTRIVTLVWCVFFAINALVSGLVAVYGTIGEWTFYNGFLSYLIVGLLFAGEYAFRHFYKRRGTSPTQY